MATPDPGSPPPTPRWVVVSGIIAIALLAVFLVVHLMGGGLGHH
jgi:hypothetical protein